MVFRRGHLAIRFDKLIVLMRLRVPAKYRRKLKKIKVEIVLYLFIIGLSHRILQGKGTNIVKPVKTTEPTLMLFRSTTLRLCRRASWFGYNIAANSKEEGQNSS